MNKAEVKAIIESELATYRLLPYAELRSMIEQPTRKLRITGASGVTYQVDVYATWERAVGGPVRVWVTADDGGWRAFMPLSQTFIKDTDGRFVGEAD